MAADPSPDPAPDAGPDLGHVDTWIFDLDNTLYPPECDLFALIDDRMQAFVQRNTGLGPVEARALQKRYYHEHGTTLAGLMAHHGVDPKAFLDEVHEVSMDRLVPDPELRAAIARLPGRRLVFTNGGEKHAERVLDRLNLNDLLEDTFHLESADFTPKPALASYHAMMAKHGVDPKRAAFFEDSEKNLKPAADLGMTTILVGPRAEASTADFVHHRTWRLTPFLNAALLREAA